METEVLAVEIAKLELGPGDVLLCSLKKPFDRDMKRVRELSDHLRKILGHDRFMIVDSDAIEFSVAKHPDGGHVQD